MLAQNGTGTYSFGENSVEVVQIKIYLSYEFEEVTFLFLNLIPYY